MNAQCHTIKLRLQQKEVFESVYGLLHTLVFYRSSAVGECRSTLYNDQAEMTTLDYVDCETVRFKHVLVRSPELESIIRRKTRLFCKDLKLSDMQCGSLCLEFYEKPDPFIPKTETWEVWKIEVRLQEPIKPPNEQRIHQQKVRQDLIDSVIFISSAVNASVYLPMASSPADIPRIYDTSFEGLQPYHFRISHKVGFQGQRSTVFSDLCKWIEKLSFLN